MSGCKQAARPLTLCLRQAQAPAPMAAAAAGAAARRAFSSTPRRREEQIPTTTTSDSSAAAAPPPPPPPAPPAKEAPAAASDASASTEPAAAAAPKKKGRKDPDFYKRAMDPEITTLHWAERKLLRKGIPLIGSRRRRVAVRTSQNIPFNQLPYQCFQEARKILLADREEKIKEIVRETARIKTLEAMEDTSGLKKGDITKRNRLKSLHNEVEKLKILADSSDPEVKRRFEDGLGDMNKPIYRHLAKKRWEGMPLRMIKQRISQFHIVPDLLPVFEPVMDVQLHYRGRRVEPGEILDSTITELPPQLRVQCFDSGERLVTIAVVDSDVPLVEEDRYGRRCHFLAANVPLNPTTGSINLARIKNAAIPWLPPYSQKGSPYHRLSIFIMRQDEGLVMDVDAMRKKYERRTNFSIKSLRDRFPGLKAEGYNIFRSVWDENTADVMARHNIPGADIEFRNTRVHSLKPPRKARGWEAKRQGPKYRHLWKYTHRIATPKRKFVK